MATSAVLGKSDEGAEEEGVVAGGANGEVALEEGSGGGGGGGVGVLKQHWKKFR